MLLSALALEAPPDGLAAFLGCLVPGGGLSFQRFQVPDAAVAQVLPRVHSDGYLCVRMTAGRHV